ncbi:MAG: 4-alpha-glucanotransferase, partial [Chloroflexi bacterium]|nr:4-alpha-glucanotransferase [Chloroflexota bacterium]
AHLYGLQTAYYDVNHHLQQATPDILLTILRSLGAPVNTLQDVSSAWQERQQAVWQRSLPPVLSAWDGKPLSVKVRLPHSSADATINYHLQLENNEEHSGQWHVTDQKAFAMVEVAGLKYVRKRFLLPEGLPWGYHRLTLEVPGRQQKYEESLIISAPSKAYAPPDDPDNRLWGVFLPLYALRSRKNWGIGDFPELGEVIDFASNMGGKVVATLPLLASLLNGGADPSPYRPVSRLLWNELHLDINKIPEVAACPAAQGLLASTAVQNEIEALRNSPLVEYPRLMALKRQILAELSRCLFSQESPRLGMIRNFIQANPVVEDYARFRATIEKQHLPWQSWPSPLKEGILKEGDYDEDERCYHLYVQWLAHQQMKDITEKARGKDLRLYLDLPLGVHPDGYDAWREQGIFLRDTSTGAPPDAVFTGGQNWGFPPLHPEKIREQGYRYVIAYLRHHLQNSGILRIDHVMGLHRLFCVPKGTEVKHGLYLRYHPEELYGILALESHRSKSIIVGEDLGIVPPYVRTAMKRHGLQQMYVLYYELATNQQEGLHPIYANTVASLNTHDMPTFAAFWQGLDVKERIKYGFLKPADVPQEEANAFNKKRVLANLLRERGWLQDSGENMAAILKACLSLLAASQTRLGLINLEDLWLETHTQNVPGTTTEHPNWRYKMRYTLEEFVQMPEVIEILSTVNRLRQQGKSG